MNKRAISSVGAAVGAAAIIGIAILGVLAYNNWIWQQTHYEVKAGYVAIVTDQIGSIIRLEKGPRGWAEKAVWETVTNWNVQARTEDMISPSEKTTMNNFSVTIMKTKPLGKQEGYSKDLRYGAVPFTTSDGGMVSIDISMNYHFDVDSEGWETRIRNLYTFFPGTNPDTLSMIEEAALSMVRGALRSYCSDVGYTTDELAYTKLGETERNSLPYVQTYLNNVTTLSQSIIIDNIAFRSRVPDANLQIAHQERLIAVQTAETLLINAEAIRKSTIMIAEGQSIAISLVTNATSSSIDQLMAQNVTAQEAVQYLGIQYQYDALRKIAEAHPDWKLTIFIQSPDLTYTIPVSP